MRRRLSRGEFAANNPKLTDDKTRSLTGAHCAAIRRVPIDGDALRRRWRRRWRRRRRVIVVGRRAAAFDAPHRRLWPYKRRRRALSPTRQRAKRRTSSAIEEPQKFALKTFVRFAAIAGCGGDCALDRGGVGARAATLLDARAVEVKRQKNLQLRLGLRTVHQYAKRARCKPTSLSSRSSP